MPDNTRTLYETPAPSGAADVLFNIFKDNQEMEQYAKKKDVDTTAAMKLNEQQNKFKVGLAELTNQYDIARASKAAEIARQEAITKGTAINQLAQNAALEMSKRTGMAVPGLTMAEPTSPGQAEGTETPGFRATTINPLASPETARIFDTTLSKHFANLAAKEGRQFILEHEAIRDRLDLVGDHETKTAQHMLGELEKTDPKSLFIPLLRGITPGMPGRKQVHEDLQKIGLEVEKSRAILTRTKELATIRANNAIQVRQMINDSLSARQKLALGGAQAKAGVKSLTDSQRSLNIQYETYQDRNRDLSMERASGMANNARLVEIDIEIEKNKMDIDRIRQEMRLNQDAINKYNQISPPTINEQENLDKKALGARILREMGVEDATKMTEKQQAEFLDRLKKAGAR